MIKDAELNAEDDKKKREMIELKNSAETQLHTIRKELSESTVSQDIKDKVETAIKELDDALMSEDKDDITQKLSDLLAASQTLMEEKNNSETQTVDAEVV